MADVLLVDAYKAGWVAVVLRNGRFIGAPTHRTLEDATQQHRDCAVITVDIPIGLPNMDQWVREADSEALRLYRSSPPRASRSKQPRAEPSFRGRATVPAWEREVWLAVRLRALQLRTISTASWQSRTP